MSLLNQNYFKKAIRDTCDKKIWEYNMYNIWEYNMQTQEKEWLFKHEPLKLILQADRPG